MIVDPPIRSSPTPEATPQRSAADLAIRVSGVGKMYRIYDRPQDRLKQMLFWRLGRSYGREFWALRNVSFEVKKGESIGIIGRNGSGKSTLLQIVAGTLAPSEGEVQIGGRVAALLELGSGFNPEFTGRENVYLNAAILGLNQEETESRFDQIASFADIGEFIDQPVKLYSSGMIVRLAFAVQAHVDPDVLIVDEALAVGDVYFQHKCMRQIKALIDRGTTLLFVSHSTDTVKRFCHRAIWINNGKLQYAGDAGVAVEKYLAFMRMLESADAPADPLEATVGTSSAAELREELHVAPGLDTSIVPLIHHEIALSDERLFVGSDWAWETWPGLPRPVRRSTGLASVAAFRALGDALVLIFLAGRGYGMVKLTVDDRSQVIDLRQSGDPRQHTVHITLGPGEHRVVIQPASAQDIRWIGGHVHHATELRFYREAAFSATTSDVERYGTGKGRITAVELLDYSSEQPVTDVHFGQRVRLRIHAEQYTDNLRQVEFSFVVRDRNRIDLFGTTTSDENVHIEAVNNRYVAEFSFDVRLGPGSYSVLAALVEIVDEAKNRLPMDVIDIGCVFKVPFDPNRPIWYLYHEPVVIRTHVE